jgi:hypothetical protein
LFRKLYWVTEHLDENGQSRLAGVYTSIPDLIRHGLKHPAHTRIRLSLTKLDSEGMPIGTWESPEFAGLEAALAPFIKTDEFTPDQCSALLTAISQLSRWEAA